jgi:hypothetical protein
MSNVLDINKVTNADTCDEKKQFCLTLLKQGVTFTRDQPLISEVTPDMPIWRRAPNAKLTEVRGEPPNTLRLRVTGSVVTFGKDGGKVRLTLGYTLSFADDTALKIPNGYNSYMSQKIRELGEMLKSRVSLELSKYNPNETDWSELKD